MTQTVSTSVPATLVDTAARFDGLLRSVNDPDAIAVGRWTVAETVAHMAVVSYFDAMTCRPDIAVPPQLESLLPRISHARIADLDQINPDSVDLFDERDLVRLADHITSNVGIIAFAATAEPDRIGTWLGGLPIPMSAVAAHYLGELAIHGLDIARSQGLPWDIAPHEARLAFEAAYMPILEVASDMLSSPSHKPVSVEFRVPGERSYTIDIVPGRITITPSGDGAADVVLRSDTVSLLLMMFERINPFTSVLAGRVRVSGRRPWRILRFRRQVRMP